MHKKHDPKHWECVLKRIAHPEQPVYYQFETWERLPLQHGVFTRLGGVSRAPWASLNVGSTVGDDAEAVAENYRRMFDALDLNGKQVCTVWQVHGTETVRVNGPHPERAWLAKADGMVTNKTDVALTMRFADCTPILLYDPVHHALGMAHAGWRGTVAGAAASTLKVMQETFGTDPADVLAAIGPSIGPAAYQVGEEVVQAVEDHFGTTDGFISRAEDGSAYFDLWEANRYALAKAGVKSIEIAGICTASNTIEFFSHRAEKGRTGRFGVVVALQDKS